jgi:hypothetical protein
MSYPYVGREDNLQTEMGLYMTSVMKFGFKVP